MNDNPISHFWEKFIEKTKGYGVSDKAIRWYVKHGSDM